jgi:hypothetical protein
MVKTASITDAKQSFIEGAAVAPARYKRKVQVADWQTPAASAEAQALYQAKMTDPTVLARRQKKIAKVSNASWQNAAANNGAAIIGQRMSAASDKWATGEGPFLSALASLTLPAKVADPMSNVTNRVGAVVQAMVATKKSQMGE